MVEQDLATRTQDPNDRRKAVIALSERGKRINAQIDRIGDVEREFLIALNRDERERLYALLDKVR